MRLNGFSRISSKRGKIRPRPMAVSATSPAHRIASCGRCSSDSSDGADEGDQAEAEHQAADHPVRPQPIRQRRLGLDRGCGSAARLGDRLRAGALCAGEEDHRQHRQNAWRDARYQTAQKADQYKCEHVSYSEPQHIWMGRISGEQTQSPRTLGVSGAFASARGSDLAAGGISTVSIMYTCALAVETPPHTSPASFTLRPLPSPVTVTSAPCTVLCVPTTFAGLA